MAGKMDRRQIASRREHPDIFLDPCLTRPVAPLRGLRKQRWPQTNEALPLASYFPTIAPLRPIGLATALLTSRVLDSVPCLRSCLRWRSVGAFLKQRSLYL